MPERLINPEKPNSQEEIRLVLEEVRTATEALVEQLKSTEYYKWLCKEVAEKAKEKIAKLEAGENFFVKKVLEAAFTAREKYSKGLALFDIDETLVKTNTAGGTMATGPTSYKTIIRPAALPVLRKLHELEFITGFLTTRGPSEGLISIALNDERNLLGLKDMIDTTRVYSTKDEKAKEIARKAGIREGDADVEPLYQYHLQRGVVKPDLTEYEKDSLAVSGYFEKCLLVASVKGELDTDTALLVVDDEKYPHLFNQTNGIYGVELSWGGKDNGGAFMLDRDFISL